MNYTMCDEIINHFSYVSVSLYGVVIVLFFVVCCSCLCFNLHKKQYRTIGTNTHGENTYFERRELKPISIETGLYQYNPCLYPQFQPIQFVQPQII